MSLVDPLELLRKQIEQINGLQDKHAETIEFKSWDKMNRMIFDRSIKNKGKLEEYDVISFEESRIRWEEENYPSSEDIEIYKKGLDEAKILFETIIKEIQMFGRKEEKMENDRNTRGFTFSQSPITIHADIVTFGQSGNNIQDRSVQLLSYSQIYETISQMKITHEKKEEFKTDIQEMENEVNSKAPNESKIKQLLVKIWGWTKDNGVEIFLSLLKPIFDIWTKKL